jgi:hydroxyacylglutathione hydrolase
LAVEPENKELKSYAAHVANLRSKGLPTVSFGIVFPC